jgi:hypothetical protein
VEEDDLFVFLAKLVEDEHQFPWLPLAEGDEERL